MERRRILSMAVFGVAVVLMVMCGATSFEVAGPVYAQGETWWQTNWAMAGANPQRTSWVPSTAENLTEIRGALGPVWYRPIDPFINGKTQVIAAHGLLYISTARGLYALDAETGDISWVYPTELPLGHSPTVVESVLYVGGYDKRIHAIEADPDPSTLPVDGETGYRVNDRVVWTFDQAEAGFETNPLIVNGVVYVGNRDGYMYALNSSTGGLLWKYKSGGPILFSAAYNDGVIYFASNDAHAYALEADDGSLVWKSDKLPGAGFHSFWPVIYGDYLILAGGHNFVVDYELSLPGELGTKFDGTELRDVFTANGIPADELVSYPNGTGTEPGDWVNGTVTIDAFRIVDYLEEPTPQEAAADPAGLSRNNHKPWKRTYLVLNRSNGQEATFDADQDGQADYAPFLWGGSTHSGNKYPPVMGVDGVLYQFSTYISDPWIARGHVTGWKFGTRYISVVKELPWGAPIDELHTFSAGGSLIYFQHWESEAGAFDITTPLGGGNREWQYYSYNLGSVAPGYSVKYPSGVVYGNQNGVYGGPQNPPIPYRGKVYYHINNCLLAFGPGGSASTPLPTAQPVAAQQAHPSISSSVLQQRLAEEVQKMIDAGHLRPGYHGAGIPDPNIGPHYLAHYFHNPIDTIYTLILALPHLPPDLVGPARAYIQQEYSSYPPYQIAHIGWRDGAPREVYDTLPEVQAKMDNFGPRTSSYSEWPWDFPQYNFYGLWKYAQEFGGAGEIFDQIRNRVEMPPGDSYLADYPYMHNAYIAGYIGYLELQKLAGEAESTNVRNELNRLLSLRVSQFSKDNWFTEWRDYRRALNASKNFMYLVPELAEYMNQNAYAEVEEAIDEYNYVVPCWFVSKYDSTFEEGMLDPLYNYPSLFQAKAYILKQPLEELVKYLDVPAFARGDLFYIQNLVAALEASRSLDLEKTASPTVGDQGTVIAYSLSLFGDGSVLALTDTLPTGVSAPGSFELVGTSITPVYDGGEHRLTWSDSPPAGQEVTISYGGAIATSARVALVNVAELRGEGGDSSTAQATVVANPYLEKTASPAMGDQGTAITYTLRLIGTGDVLTLTDALPAGVGAPGNFELVGTNVVPIYDSDQHRLTWNDSLPAGQAVTIRYVVVIGTSAHEALVNVAELRGEDGFSRTAQATVVANPYLQKTASPTIGDQGTAVTYTLSLLGTGDTLMLTDTLPAGVSAPGNIELVGTSTMPVYDGSQHRLTWSNSPPADHRVTIRYGVVITTSAHVALVNVAELKGGDGDPHTVQATVVANPYLEKTASPTYGTLGEGIDYTLSFLGTGDLLTLTDTLPAGVSTPDSFELVGTSIAPAYDGSQHRLTWNDSPPAGQEVTIRYGVVIATSAHEALVNVAELRGEDGDSRTAQAAVVANSYLEKTASPTSGTQGTVITYTLSLIGTGDVLTLTDTLPAGVSAPSNIESVGTVVLPFYDSEQHRLAWSGAPAAGQEMTFRYSTVIITSSRRSLVNVAELTDSGGQYITTRATVLCNPIYIYLPLVFKDWERS
jgi:outer membrane protein assembly factor BamB